VPLLATSTTKAVTLEPQQLGLGSTKSDNSMVLLTPLATKAQQCHSRWLRWSRNHI
jgi:hypothetical protein